HHQHSPFCLILHALHPTSSLLNTLVPFQAQLEVNVVLVGFSGGDGGYRYKLDTHNLGAFFKLSFPTHRPACLETVSYNVFLVIGQQELIALEKAVKGAMVPAGTVRENEFGREVPFFEVDAKAVEPVFEHLYSYIFDMDGRSGESTEEMDKHVSSAIFVVNFDKVRMDPRNKEFDLDNLMYGTIPELTEEEMKKQEAEYIYCCCYNGGGVSQVWLGSGRFVVVDLSAGPCTHGKIETEEGSVSYRTLPRLSNLLFPKGSMAASVSIYSKYLHGTAWSFDFNYHSTCSSSRFRMHMYVVCKSCILNIFDFAKRLLVPIIVLRNHNRYNIMDGGHNYSRDVQAIEAKVHMLYICHEKLSIVVSKAMRGHSLQETKPDGRFHVHTKTYLDGRYLKNLEMERSGDVLTAGLLEVSDPSLSSKCFLRQNWMENSDGASDSVIKHRPIWETYILKRGNIKKKDNVKKLGDLYRTYGTRLIPV
ncbi:hypothetical protein MKW92_021157, partial [Papaver armeniacum]